jgi:uncharacterized protein YhfF
MVASDRPNAPMAASVQVFWRAYADATGIDAPYEAWAFGGDDTPELATELGLLVRDGPKRATTACWPTTSVTARRCRRSAGTA